MTRFSVEIWEMDEDRNPDDVAAGGRSSERLAEGWPSIDSIESVERSANARWDGNEH